MRLPAMPITSGVSRRTARAFVADFQFEIRSPARINPASIQFHIGGLDPLGPEFDLLAHISGHGLWGSADGVRRKLRETLAHVVLAKRLVHAGIDLVDDPRRRLGRPHGGGPGCGLKAWERLGK